MKVLVEINYIISITLHDDFTYEQLYYDINYEMEVLIEIVL